MQQYVVVEIPLTDAERISVVKNRNTGLPAFEPVVWATHILRSEGQRPNSINQALRSWVIMQGYFDTQGIDLDARLRDGRFLTRIEATGLSNACRQGLRQTCPPGNGASEKTLASVRLKMSDRRSTKTPTSTVSESTASIRAHYIRTFLQWKLEEHLMRLGVDEKRHQSLRYVGQLALDAFSAASPRQHNYGGLEPREGLSEESRLVLETVTDPEAQANPWNVGAHPILTTCAR